MYSENTPDNPGGKTKFDRVFRRYLMQMGICVLLAAIMPLCLLRGKMRVIMVLYVAAQFFGSAYVVRDKIAKKKPRGRAGLFPYLMECHLLYNTYMGIAMTFFFPLLLLFTQSFEVLPVFGYFLALIVFGLASSRFLKTVRADEKMMAYLKEKKQGSNAP